MFTKENWLRQYRKNVYSQFGEDGIIQQILKRLQDLDGWCVEFGAWDGKYLSNTANLIENHDYSSILIECDEKKFERLITNYNNNTNVYCVNRSVGFSSDDNLDEILRNYTTPRNFDFLSIDIDGNDYHVWNATQLYRPKCVCIEFNPTVPIDLDYVQAADKGLNRGCGLAPLVKLGKAKGYELVCVNECNSFFVNKNYFPRFEIQDNSPEILNEDQSAVTQICVGYDGHVCVFGNKNLLWHGIRFEESDLQILPDFLQIYPAAPFGYSRRVVNVLRLIRYYAVKAIKLVLAYKRISEKVSRYLKEAN